ncbi:hypothetical protein SAMN05428950_10217 [Sphingomonas sp. OV641]|uniref:beta strand repeat-containing protein n=1 Tax=Sphingomonas sp. OV641 TaxID=1881068 RepID=UPI0008C46C76|nr:calcium-binding protein [Sphingomonas sp. OV641]SEJ56273.1 hypothetical protein SAMN05428950_10217 [Sphingomonas sp. OV641]
MANITLQTGQELAVGNPDEDDIFIGNEDNFDAGDILVGYSGFDRFRFFADGDYGGRTQVTYGAFELRSVERLEVTNDSTAQLIFDMSGSAQTSRYAVTNSTNSVRFTQIDNINPNTSLDIIDTTDASTTDVEMLFRDRVLTGANDQVSVNVTRTDVSTVRIGSVGTGNAGIETVNLMVRGNSVIDRLDTNLTTLNISGTGSIAIATALNATVRTIDATGASGRLSFSFANNLAGASVIGSTGADTITAGVGDDRIETRSGNDYVNAGGGNNTISAGEGNDVIDAGGGEDYIDSGIGDDRISAAAGRNVINAGQGRDVIFTGGDRDVIDGGDGDDYIESGDAPAAGLLREEIDAGEGNDLVLVGAGRHDVDGGTGNDTISFGDNLDARNDVSGIALDIVNGGAGTDTLQISALGGSDQDDDARFENVVAIETLELATAGDTWLGGNNGALNQGGLNNAEQAGISRITLLSSGDDVVDASSFDRALRIGTVAGGADTVTSGRGDDAFNWADQLTDGDDLDGGEGADSLTINFTTTLTTASLFNNIEQINLLSGYGSRNAPATYNLTLDNDNAPTTGGRLSVRAVQLSSGPLGAETLTLDGSAVTNFAFDISGGGASDVIRGGALADTVAAGGGSDTLIGVGGDTLDGQGGSDAIILLSGNNVALGGGGADRITLGTGADNVSGGAGNDTIVAGDRVNADQLSAADTINGGAGGIDTLLVQGAALVDAAFTNVSDMERLIVVGTGSNVQIGREAEESGIRSVYLNNAARIGDTLDAGQYSADLLVDASAGGNDRIITGGGNDTIDAGSGDQSVTSGSGNDTLIVDDSEFNTRDAFNGGAGEDTVLLNNVSALGDGQAVDAAVNLDLVRNVEVYRLAGDGSDPSTPPAGNDADIYSLSFEGSVASGVGSLVNITVDSSLLADTLDTTQITLDDDLLDADYQLTIRGSAATTEVFKNNIGTNNNIRFQGGAGVDRLYVNGGDLGSTITFNGNAGTDAVVQTGGLITDDSYGDADNDTVGVRGVEILESTAATAVNAILGDRASASGLQTVNFSDQNNRLFLDGGFTTALTINLAGGDDTVTGAFNGSVSGAAVTFVGEASAFTNGDTLQGGSGSGDVAQIIVAADNQIADLTNLTEVETISMVVGASASSVFTSTTLVLDTSADDIAGDTQTISAAGNAGTFGDAYFINAAAATANLVVNLATAGTPNVDYVISGSGNDVIDLGAAGSGGFTYGFGLPADQDRIAAGAGNDRVTGVAGSISTGIGDDNVLLSGAGIDQDSRVNLGAGDDIATLSGGDDRVQGDAGSDTLDGGAGSDVLSGGAGQDTMLGGAGDDVIHGGAEADTLTGGAGRDVFVFTSGLDSATPQTRDTVTDFVSGTDRIDLRSLQEAVGLGSVEFLGNVLDFADAQTSVTAGEGALQVVFETNRSILWADVNDDGVLDGLDIQIKLDGVTSLTAQDVFAVAGQSTVTGGGIAGFEAAYGFNTAFFIQDAATTILP